ncbi:MAG: PAS domain-containing protein, partial [Pseudomonadales bacterium]|nr:PAS domain-containing protein [Pseudomonadales bacterium]
SVSAQRIKDLEAEHRSTSERLNLTVEELETTNEELQSSNEELLASNEELQSTNEELQSVNEELYTVNSEYQEKIREVSTINDDFNSLVNTVDVGIVFLDEKLLIRKFSPAAARHINLLPGDIGRPIHHIAHNLKLDTFLDTIAQVASTGQPFTKEVPTKTGGWVSMTINAVNSSYNNDTEYHSCVVSLTDISEIRSTEGAIKQAYEQLRRTVALRSKLTRTTLRTLILDDDPDDIELIKGNLDDVNSMVFKCKGYSDIDEMRLALREQEYDLCIMDLNLGAVTGFELLEELGDENIRAPILLISGVLNEEKSHQAASLGIYDTIDKNSLSSSVLEHVTRFVIQQRNLENILVANHKDSAA